MTVKKDIYSMIYFTILTIQTTSFVNGKSPPPETGPTAIIWSLAPCQAVFWIPSAPNEFSQNWITYQYEGNPFSLSEECIFTFESDPDTKIEIMIQDIHSYGSGATSPTPCLSLYDVKQDGTVVLLKKKCNVISANDFSAFSLFTEENLAVISSTLRYGSFQLQARAIPTNFGVSTKVITSSNIAPLATDSIATMAQLGRPTSTNSPSISMISSMEMILPTKMNRSLNSPTNVILG